MLMASAPATTSSKRGKGSTVPLVHASVSGARTAAAQQQTGLDWDGTGTVRRMLYWLNPPAAYPMTFFFKVYPRNQVGSDNRYSTTFFRCHNGAFVWGANYDASYYGAHAYPVPAATGDGKWEVSANANDFTTRDDGSSPVITFDRWYSQAFTAENTGGANRRMLFNIDLANVSTATTITRDSTSGHTEPPTPAIVVGQAPDNGSGLSWGGYPRWEEAREIIRGLHFHTDVLSQVHRIALGALETDAEVLAYCSGNGISAPWYLNMNPRPDDVTDKSGNGHHGTFEGVAPPLWTA